MFTEKGGLLGTQRYFLLQIFLGDVQFNALIRLCLQGDALLLPMQGSMDFAKAHLK